MAGEAAKIVRAVKKYGRPMLLRRRVGTTTTYQDVSLRGLSRHYKAAEITGLLQQGDREITITNAEISAQSAFAGPPRKGDFLLVDGVNTAVQTVEPQYLKTEVLAFILTVRG